MTTVAIIGAGGWGSRVAHRLKEFDDVLISGVFDADEGRAQELASNLGTSPLKAFPGYMDVMQPEAVVLAVPAGCRQSFIDTICSQTNPPRLRIEKPLGLAYSEAQAIEKQCADAGVDLTIGFTLLHHPLYDAVFEYLRAKDFRVEHVTALRIGASPAHHVDAMLDIGIHAASVASFLGATANITAFYKSNAQARTTTMHCNRGTVVVDELLGVASTPDGDIRVEYAHDALGHDLRAWLDRKHRGTPHIAVAAQMLVENRLLEVAA